MQQLIDPLVDCVFTSLFGSRLHKQLAIHFINALLDRKTHHDPITDVVLIGPDAFIDPDHGPAATRIHLRGYTASNRALQITLRLAIHPGSPERMLYAWNGLVHEPIASDSDCVPHVSIWILREVLFPAPNPHLVFRPWCQQTQALLSPESAIHVLQIPVAAKQLRIYNEADRWLCFLSHARDLNLHCLPDWMDTPEMRDALRVLKNFQADESMYHFYLRRLEQRVYASNLMRKSHMSSPEKASTCA
jgi:hypothetical protein